MGSCFKLGSVYVIGITLVCSVSPIYAQQLVTCNSATSDADGDGWGWENNASCMVTVDANEASDNCIDSDGDGYGWDGTATCLTTVPGETNLPATPQTTNCIDSDGDGYGWDGTATCLITATDETTLPVAPQTTECVDSDGDGYGWDGLQTCLVQNGADLPDQFSGEEYCADTKPYNDGRGQILRVTDNQLLDESCPLAIALSNARELPLDNTHDDLLGCCGTIASSEELLVIGAGRNYYSQNVDNDPGDRRGLLVFEKDADSNFQLSTVIHQGKNSGEFVVQENRIIASGDDNAVYIYEKDGEGSWLTTRVTTDDQLSARSFGQSIAVDGDRLVVSAIDLGSFAPTPHSVYVFDKQANGNWINTAKLYPQSGVDNDVLYGADVAVSGSRVIVGAPSTWKIDSTAYGRVYLFENLSPTEWVESTLIPDDSVHVTGESNERFGFSVAISNEIAAVGDPDLDVPGSIYYPGAVYLFRHERESSADYVRITASDYKDVQKVGNDMTFGRNIILTNNTLLVGGASVTTGGINNSVYLYSLANGTIQSETIRHNTDRTHSYGDYFSFNGEELAVVRTGRFFEDYIPQVELFKISQ